MKDFIKLTKEAGRFYLTAFGIALFFVLCNNIYLMNEYKQEAIAGKKILDMGNIFYDKAVGYDLLNYWIVLAGILLFLFIRHFSFVDKRSMEFQMFLPVKKRMTVIHDYVSSVVILVVVWLISAVSFFITQEVYNQKMIGKNALLTEDAQMAGRHLWQYGIFYLVYLLLVFSLLYFGITICKNSIVGMILVGLLWGIANIFQIGYPEYLFSSIQENTKMENGRLFVILVGAVVFIDILIVLAAQFRELSKGKWFYFLWVDYFVIASGGIMAFVTLILFQLSWIAIPAGIFVSGLLFFLWDRGNEKAVRLEVK